MLGYSYGLLPMKRILNKVNDFSRLIISSLSHTVKAKPVQRRLLYCYNNLRDGQRSEHLPGIALRFVVRRAFL